MIMNNIVDKINASADLHAAGLPADRANLVDSSADVVMGTPTFFLAGIGIAQLIISALD